ncbi:MAG: alpha/beta hydrolase [Burkholderiaceae bacterium]|nr:alpha/beta hydrolase [Burkholderiaceae bacterium]
MAEEPPADANGPRRLTGLSGLLGVLRNLGLVGDGQINESLLDGFIADDGQRIPLQIQGSGPPVLLLHGMGCSHRHWARVARRLARHYRVFAWDARGHGACRMTAGARITLARLAHDIADLLDEFFLERAVLVGHSMGALTVLQYLRDYGTARVAAVGLVDQSPRIVTDEDWRLGLFGSCSAQTLNHWLAAARENLAETVLREVQAACGNWLRRRLAPDAALGRLLRARLQTVDLSALLTLCESIIAADFRAMLPHLDVPVLVVLGGRSAHYGNVPLAAYYGKVISHARVLRYARSGHSPHYAEPARFARDLHAFVAEHWH